MNLSIPALGVVVALAVVLLLALPVADAEPVVASKAAETGPPTFELRVDTILKGFDGQSHWYGPRGAVVPADERVGPLQIILLQRAFMSASDYFSGYHILTSRDFGATWSAPREVREVGWRDLPGGITQGINAVTPGWHGPTGRILALGRTVRYVDGKHMPEPHPREVGYAVFDPATGRWTPWKTLDMPDPDRFFSAGAGAAQWLTEPDGSLLVPIYFKPRSSKPLAGYSATVLRCSFDGTTLKYLAHGDELTVGAPRGLYEPSLTKFGGRYFLTLRNDENGYVSSSPDGLHWSKARPWVFDDGKDLGNYNTQQHWATHSDGLFLVYARRGADNDHVFRHRAPLFIGRVDPDRLCVIRESERIVIPLRGAPLGNFGVTAVNERETWITASEEMLAWVRTKRGPADGSVYLARILWSRPNRTR